jgi:hypothetical protein
LGEIVSLPQVQATESERSTPEIGVLRLFVGGGEFFEGRMRHLKEAGQSAAIGVKGFGSFGVG